MYIDEGTNKPFKIKNQINAIGFIIFIKLIKLNKSKRRKFFALNFASKLFLHFQELRIEIDSKNFRTPEMYRALRFG
jgi:hypothetical protein